MKTPVIETERLVLRPLSIEDAETIFNGWARDKEVAYFMRWNLHKDIDVTKEWLTGEQAAVISDDVYNWGFTLKENQQLIGCGGLIFSQEHHMFEIGYNLMRDCWGKGFATEAAKRIIQYAKEELRINQLFATLAVENTASGNVLRKLGFIYQTDGTYSSYDGTRTFQSREYIKTL